jgi:hypothetical protein
VITQKANIFPLRSPSLQDTRLKPLRKWRHNESRGPVLRSFVLRTNVGGWRSMKNLSAIFYMKQEQAFALWLSNAWKIQNCKKK